MLPNTTFTATLIDKNNNALTFILRCVRWKNRTTQTRFISANKNLVINNNEADRIIYNCICNTVRGFDVEYWYNSDLLITDDGDFVNHCYSRLTETTGGADNA